MRLILFYIVFMFHMKHKLSRLIESGTRLLLEILSKHMNTINIRVLIGFKHFKARSWSILCK